MNDKMQTSPQSPDVSEIKARRTKMRPPFQLCFAKEHQQGRSLLSKPKLPDHASIVTPKFYSKSQSTSRVHDDPLVEELEIEIEKLGRENPKDLYDLPLLESQSYGWFTETLLQTDKLDRRLNHHNNSSEMVKIQCKLYNATQEDKAFQQFLDSSKQKQ